jgi:hypothetical protein
MFVKYDKYKGGYSSWCRACYNKVNTANMRKKTSGVNQEQYNAAFEAQDGRCLICGRHRSELKRDLHADHDHETGEFRGLLCGRCNMGLGYFLDNKWLLLRALEYLWAAEDEP